MRNNSYDPERLWIKARLFINRAMDPERDFEECAFWAAASLELLGKAALATVNPLLIANPADDGHSLLVASGAIEDRNFFSIPAKALWSRCKRTFRPFDESEAKRISAARNNYLHGGSTGLAGTGPEKWWPSYWAQASTLVGHLHQGIESFVGPSRAATVERFLAMNRDHQANRLQVLKERAQLRLSQHRNDTLPARVAAEWNAFSTGGYSYEESATCPACAGLGLLQGDEILETKADYHPTLGDPRTLATLAYDIEVWLTVGAEAFVCPTCHLELEEFDLIQLAGLEDSFVVQGDPSDYDEPEYNNE